MENLGFFDRVYQAVKAIPAGRVATYGQIARLIGAPRCARQVGYALHANPTPIVVPCHRVVNRFGRVSESFGFGGKQAQIALLRSEGVPVSDEGEVDLSVFLWRV